MTRELTSANSICPGLNVFEAEIAEDDTFAFRESYTVIGERFTAKEVYANYSLTVSGDLIADKIVVNKDLLVDGNISAEYLECHGKITCSGDLNATEINVTGFLVADSIYTDVLYCSDSVFARTSIESNDDTHADGLLLAGEGLIGEGKLSAAAAIANEYFDFGNSVDCTVLEVKTMEFTKPELEKTEPDTEPNIDKHKYDALERTVTELRNKLDENKAVNKNLEDELEQANHKAEYYFAQYNAEKNKTQEFSPDITALKKQLATEEGKNYNLKQELKIAVSAKEMYQRRLELQHDYDDLKKELSDIKTQIDAAKKDNEETADQLRVARESLRLEKLRADLASDENTALEQNLKAAMEHIKDLKEHDSATVEILSERIKFKFNESLQQWQELPEDEFIEKVDYCVSLIPDLGSVSKLLPKIVNYSYFKTVEKLQDFLYIFWAKNAFPDNILNYETLEGVFSVLYPKALPDIQSLPYTGTFEETMDAIYILSTYGVSLPNSKDLMNIVLRYLKSNIDNFIRSYNG